MTNSSIPKELTAFSKQVSIFLEQRSTDMDAVYAAHSVHWYAICPLLAK